MAGARSPPGCPWAILSAQMAFNSPPKHFPLIPGRKELLGWQLGQKGSPSWQLCSLSRAGSALPSPARFLSLAPLSAPPLPSISPLFPLLPQLRSPTARGSPRRPPCCLPAELGSEDRIQTQSSLSAPQDQAGDASRAATIRASRCSGRSRLFTVLISVTSHCDEPPWLS